MKKYYTLCMVLVILVPATYSQTCNDAMVMALKTDWKDEKDVYMKGQPGLTPAMASLIFKNTDAYKKLFFAAYPQAIGGTIRGFGYIPEQSVYDMMGTQAYQYKADYFGYHCSRDGTEIVTDHNYMVGSPATVEANFLKGILNLVGDDFELDGKSIKLFRLAPRLEDHRGYLLFRVPGFEDNNAILITHDGKLPYRYISRKEYLNIIENLWNKNLRTGLDNIDKGDSLMLKIIEDTKKDFTGELRDNMLKELYTQLDLFRKSKDADKKKFSISINEELDAIKEYRLSASEEELAQPAIPAAETVYRGFTTEKEGGHYLVVLDESYFKKDLPPHAAQTLVLDWFHTKSDPGALPWRKSIEEKFPLDKLQAMIDK